MNFNYFISEAVFCYLLDAVHLVAEHGWKLLPDYVFDQAHGLWRHRSGPVEPPLRLHQVGYDEVGEMTYPHHDEPAPESALPGYLDEARRLLATRQAPPEADPRGLAGLSADFEALRWFVLPPDCLADLDAASWSVPTPR
jgi:hypothetical protein